VGVLATILILLLTFAALPLKNRESLRHALIEILLMKRNCLMPLLVSHGLALAIAGCGEGPRACPGESFDAGVIYAPGASKLSHVFSIKNTTGRSVRILKIDKSCACTTARIAATELANGESTELEMEASVPQSGAKGGLFCTVKTNSEEFPEWTYAIYYESLPRLSIEPPVLHLGTFNEDPTNASPGDGSPRPSVVVTVHAMSLTDLGLEVLPTVGLDLSTASMDEDPSPVGKGIFRKRYRLFAHPRLADDAPKGTQFRAVTVRAGKDESMASVAWTYKTKFRVTPSPVSFGSLEPGATSPARRVVISADRDRPFRVRSVSNAKASAGERVESRPIGEDDATSQRHSFDLRLTVPTGASASMLTGSIVVEIDDAQRTRLEIPWSAFIRNGPQPGRSPASSSP
jgi:hypothetical protein